MFIGHFALIVWNYSDMLLLLQKQKIDKDIWMKIIADLHIHTVYSDGSRTPEEIVDMALKKKLKAIAISDHDSLGGIKRATSYAGDKLKIIPAIEMSSEHEKKDLHILGYYVDYKNPTLQGMLDDFARIRRERGRLIADKLTKNGYVISDDEVAETAGDGVVGRLHLAQILCRKGYARNIGDAFERFLGEHTQYYVPKYKLTPAEAFKMIRDTGGIPVWAHPGCSDFDDFLEEFVRDGLMGLEVYHPRHTKTQIANYLSLCKTHNLLITGGTDFHGSDHGRPVGEIGVDLENLTKLEEVKSQLTGF